MHGQNQVSCETTEPDSFLCGRNGDGNDDIVKDEDEADVVRHFLYEDSDSNSDCDSDSDSHCSYNEQKSKLGNKYNVDEKYICDQDALKFTGKFSRSFT